MDCVSIIVPVYNAAKYLNNCISSILGQTYGNLELILVNDGSYDDSLSICEYYRELDDRVVVLNKMNGGVSSARNEGIKAAKGEYIVFVDADDILAKDFVEIGISAIRNGNVDVFISGIQMDYYDGTQIVNTEYLGVSSDIIYNIKELLECVNIDYPLMCICGPWCKIFKKRIISENKIFFDESISFGEDTRFNLAVYANCNAVFFSARRMYFYRRINGESLFNKFKLDTYELHRDEYAMFYQLMKKKMCSDQAFHRFNNLYISMMIGCISEYYRNYKKTRFSDRAGIIRKISKDKFVQQTPIRDVNRAKDRLILLLVKNKLELLVMVIFYIYKMFCY